MQNTKLMLSSLTLVGLFALAGCSFPGVYKVDIQQGNVVTQDMIDQLRPGMTRSQVRFIMGSPLITDTFHASRWDYLYSIQPGGGQRQQERVSLVFNESDQLAGLAGDFLPGVSRDEAEATAMDLLRKMGIEDKANAYPFQLSGGQQQRVAIARALAMKPEILCFDEPTSALDPELTGEVLKVIRELADRRMTMIIVTHEMAFARDVSSHVIFMDNGIICEQGTPDQVFGHPQEERTRQFLQSFIQ